MPNNTLKQQEEDKEQMQSSTKEGVLKALENAVALTLREPKDTICIERERGGGR